MSVDIDVYEFKGTLKKLEDKDLKFLKFSEEKGVSVLEVGRNSKDIDKKLVNMNYKIGDKVLVVVQ